MAVDIKSLVNTDVVWVPYPAVEDDSFEIGLKFLAKDKALKIQNASTKRTWDKNTHQPFEQQDDEKFIRAFVKECVEGWRGLTVEKLQDMIPADLSNLSEEELSEEIEYSDEQLLDLIENDVTGLAEWLVAQTRNIENFTKRR